MGSQNCDRDPVDVLREAIHGGITAFQFREKGAGSLEGEAKRTLGKQLRQLCREQGVPFFINDDLELAKLLAPDGIHIGQDDESALEVRQRFPDTIIGLSVSSIQEAAASPLSAVDYLGVGPIYGTSSKDDAKSTRGTAIIEDLRAQYPNIPIVGIGGITTENALAVLKAGANGVSVISTIARASRPEDAARTLAALHKQR